MSDPVLAGGAALGPVPPLRPHPGAAAVFQRRAERFAALAPGHAVGDYLAFLGRLAAAQAGAAGRTVAAAPWGPASGGLPLDAGGPLPAGWRAALSDLLRSLRGEPSPGIRAAVAQLDELPPAELDALAGRVLASRTSAADLAPAPIVGAALQVAFTSAAAALAAESVERTEAGCPLCGSAPVAGVVLGDDKLRYLVCGLCATQWHHTRAQCVLCRSSGALAYLALEGPAPGPAKAEACQACRAYLKLLYVELDPRLEPFADDVASLTLDLLMAERGLERLGQSLFLIPGPAPASA